MKGLNLLILGFAVVTSQAFALRSVDERPVISTNLARAAVILEQNLGRQLTQAELTAFAQSERMAALNGKTADLDENSAAIETNRFYCAAIHVAFVGQWNGYLCANERHQTMSMRGTDWAAIGGNIQGMVVDISGPGVSEAKNYRGVYENPVGGSVGWFVSGGYVQFRGKHVVVAKNYFTANSQVDERYSLTAFGLGAGFNISGAISGQVVVN